MTGFSLSTEITPDFLIAQIRGQRTRQSVALATAEIFKLTIQAGKSRVLVDVRNFDGRLNTLDILAIVRDEFPKYRGKGIRRAGIVDRPYSSPKRWVLETFAQNRGFVLRVFDDEAEARIWLGS